MEWISVNDKLPPQSVYVLVSLWDDRPQVKMYFLLIAERIGDYWYDGNNGDNVTGRKGGRITHWMPLPETPKRVNNER